MARRSNGKPLAEDLLNLFVTWPWYVSLALAFIIFFGIDIYQQLTPEIETLPKSQKPGDLVIAALEPFKAIGLGIIKYLMPVLLITAGVISFLKSLQSTKRYETVAQSPSSDSLNEMTWKDFESLVGEYFRRQGYQVKETPEGPDGGVDLRIKKDERSYLVQCKQWRFRKIPVSVVRELFGLVASENAAGGFIVVSGLLTQEAQKFAENKPIYVIDGDTFYSFISQREKEAACFPPNNQSSLKIYRCPVCNSRMVKRVARKGPNTGQEFWGCTRFPSCFGTRDISG